jgi:hypothetical protein
VGIIRSIKAVIKYLLRLGLTAVKRPARKLFVVTPQKLELPSELTYDKIEHLLNALEGPSHQ